MSSKAAVTPAGAVGLYRSAGCSGHQEKAAVLATVIVGNQEHPGVLVGVVLVLTTL
jgi:altronate dehydratase